MKHTHNVEITFQHLRVTTRIALDRRILDDACAALEVATLSPKVRCWYERGPGRVMKVAAGLALAAAVLLVAILPWDHTDQDSQPTAGDSRSATRPRESSEADKRLAAEREEIEACYLGRDIEALVRLIGRVLKENRILIADYLGRIGDARALDALAEQAEQWQGTPAENPFSAAMNEITRRLETSEPNEPNGVAGLNGAIITSGRTAAVLEGAITDVETGTPIRGVKVYFRAVEGGQLYTTTTDADGLYALSEIGTPGSYEIWLRAREYITPDPWQEPREIIELDRGEQAEKNFALERGATLELSAVDESRRPVMGVYFHAAYLDDEFGRGPQKFVASGADGDISLGGLSPGEYHVVAAHPDYAYAMQTVRIYQTGQIESVAFELERGTDVVGLATCSDGQPPRDWMISAEPAGWPSAYTWPFPVPIADDGTFALEHILPGAYRVAVSIPVKGSPQEIWSQEMELPPQGDLLELPIPAPSSYAPNTSVSLKEAPMAASPVKVALAGCVLDKQTGRRVTDFRLRIGTQRYWRHVYDSRGRFVVEETVSGFVKIHVTAEGYVGTVIDNIDPETDAPVTIELDKPMPLEGVVLDASGVPLEQVAVSHRFAREVVAVTDSQGRFEISDVPCGDVSLWLAFRHSNYARTLQQLTVCEALPRETVVAMQQGAVVEGRLYDGQGRPRPFMPLYFLDEQQYRRGCYDRALATVATDAEGYYRVEDLPTGLCCIVPDHLNETLGVAQICVVPQAGQHLWLDIGGLAKTTGRLLNDGVPRADELLMVRYQLDDNPGFEAFARTDAQGRLCFYGMPVGQRSIYRGGREPARDSEGWCQLTTFDFQAGVDQNLGDFDITDDSKLLVELVSEASPDVLEGYDVSVTRSWSDDSICLGQFARQDENAFLFALSGLDWGYYEMVAHRLGYPLIHRPFAMQHRRDREVIKLAIPSGSATISGRLEPFISTEVYPGLWLCNTRDEGISARLQATSDGRFKVEHLPPGRYEVVPIDGTPSIADVTVQAGQHGFLDVPTNVRGNRYAEEGYLAVLVVTEDGMPLPGAQMGLGHKVGMGPTRGVADRGVRKSFAVAPDTYRLYVYHPGFRSLREEVEIHSMQGRSLQEILEPMIITMR